MIGCLSTTRRRRAFSLVELLVAIGVIALLGTLTAISVRGVARDARISSAENTVTAALAGARGLAMRDNTVVAVVFRAAWDPERPTERQRTEVITARWTGETEQPFMQPGSGLSPDFSRDRFVPIAGVPVRELPAGIKVAGPFYDLNNDQEWLTQPELILSDTTSSGNNGWRAEIIGVMFDSNGTVITRNPASNTYRYSSYLDLDGDGIQDIGDTNHNTRFFRHDEAVDETHINFVPFLSVYDEDRAREFKTQDQDELDFLSAITGFDGFIAREGRLIYFNRFTGVVQSVPDK